MIKKYQSQKIYNPYVPENSEMYNEGAMKRKKSEKVKKIPRIVRNKEKREKKSRVLPVK